MWKKANPALGDFRSLEEMRTACERAKEIPAQENTFRRLYLNQWTEQAARWIADAGVGRLPGHDAAGPLEGPAVLRRPGPREHEGLDGHRGRVPGRRRVRRALAQFFVPHDAIRAASDARPRARTTSGRARDI